MTKRSRSEKLSLLSSWKQSGKSLRAFCLEQSLCYSTLLRYRKELLPSTEDDKGFVPVEVLPGFSTPTLEIEFPSGIKVRIPETLPPSSLLPLLQTLQSIC
ncbi:MAG TPA: hypothetical protein ENK02_00415 [Planctomycetes bacterium]|nr:hypothetical protein [Planctomycetota bacterium]